MLRSYNLRISLRDPRSALQTGVVALLVLNLIAAWFVYRPLGGSAQDLEQEAGGLRLQIAQRRTMLQKTRVNVTKVESGRVQGDQFMQGFFLARRTAASAILAELNSAAKEAKVKTKVTSFNEEPIEGSDTLSMMVITSEYEGTYPELLRFVNLIDRSPRLLIIETLRATPQQGSAGVLNIGLKLDAFVREDDGLPVVTPESASGGSSHAAGEASAPGAAAAASGGQPSSGQPRPAPPQSPASLTFTPNGGRQAFAGQPGAAPVPGGAAVEGTAGAAGAGVAAAPAAGLTPPGSTSNAPYRSPRRARPRVEEE